MEYFSPVIIDARTEKLFVNSLAVHNLFGRIVAGLKWLDAANTRFHNLFCVPERMLVGARVYGKENGGHGKRRIVKPPRQEGTKVAA